MLNNHYEKVDVWLIRKIFSWLLLITALIVLPLSVIFFWLKFSIFNTDQFVKTLSPISKNSYIIESLSVNLSNNFFQNINAEDKIRKVLPEQIKFLAPALTSELKNFVAKESTVILTSDAFNNMWDKALRTIHPYLIKIMTGEGNLVVNDSGEVYLDFSEVVDKLKLNLLTKGISLFNNIPIEPKVTLFKSEKLAYFKIILNSISVLGIIFPILVILLIVGSVFVALKRLHFLFWVGLGVFASSLLLFILINSGESYFIGMAKEINRQAAGALYEIITASLKKITIILIIIGLVTGIAVKILEKLKILKGYLTK